MVRCGRVVAIFAEQSAQMHTANAATHKLKGLAILTRPDRYWEGTKNRKLATK